MGLEFTNLDDFERRLLRLAKTEYPKEAKKFMRQLARDTIKIAKTKTPKGPTGNLKKGWRIGKLYIRDNSISIVVRNRAPHAHLIEHGHRIGKVYWMRESRPARYGGTTNFATVKGTKNVKFVPGKPMLEPAMQKIETEVPQRLQNWITKLIREVGL